MTELCSSNDRQSTDSRAAVWSPDNSETLTQPTNYPIVSARRLTGDAMISRSTGARFWVEIVFAVLAAVLAVTTLINAEWIEWLTGTDPDGGDGSLEWLFAGACALVALISAALARLEWRRAQVAA